jgi:hypothetical protein
MAKTNYNLAGIENLSIGIVKQAADDYMYAKTTLYKIRRNRTFVPNEFRKKSSKEEECECERELERIKNFFHSQWYQLLTSVDANYMIAKLEEKFEAWCEEFEQKMLEESEESKKSK